MNPEIITAGLDVESLLIGLVMPIVVAMIAILYRRRNGKKSVDAGGIDPESVKTGDMSVGYWVKIFDDISGGIQESIKGQAEIMIKLNTMAEIMEKGSTILERLVEIKILLQAVKVKEDKV